jgi:hypothetical protein
MKKHLLFLAAMLWAAPALAAGYAGINSAVPVGNASTDSANAAVQTSIAAVPGQLNYVVFAQCRGTGATASSSVVATVTGLLGGSIVLPVTIPIISGNLDWYATISVPTGWPASASNTAVVIQVPAAGAGNLHAACSILGYRVPAPSP